MINRYNGPNRLNGLAGFTFIELLLAIGIVAIITSAIYQSTSYGMNVLRRVNSDHNGEVIKIVDQLSRELRCAYLVSEKHPSIRFSGTSSSVQFISVVSLKDFFDNERDFDLKERRYFLRSNAKDGLFSLVYFTEEIERTLLSEIKAFELSYFDGVQWKASWNSLVQLPEAVRIAIQFPHDGKKDVSDDFSTVILIPRS